MIRAQSCFCAQESLLVIVLGGSYRMLNIESGLATNTPAVLLLQTPAVYLSPATDLEGQWGTHPQKWLQDPNLDPGSRDPLQNHRTNNSGQAAMCP